MKSTIGLVACLLGLWGVCGCESKRSSSVSATVSGKVTYKGQPVNGGDIGFYPQTGTPYACKINPDGSFSGALPTQTRGEVIVTVQTTSLVPLASAGNSKGAAMKEKMQAKVRQEKGVQSAGPSVAIPKKYAQKTTSPLRWTLTEGPNAKNFDLTD